MALMIFLFKLDICSFSDNDDLSKIAQQMLWIGPQI